MISDDNYRFPDGFTVLNDDFGHFKTVNRD